MMKTLRDIIPGVTLAMVAISTIAQAQSEDQIIEGLTPIVEAKMRYEHVAQDNFALDANALTVGFRYGFEYQPTDGLTFRVLGDSVFRLGGNFNDFSGRDADRPIVADRQNTELDELNLHFTGIDGFDFQLGRGKVVLGNQRWLGVVPWRQSQQTYDYSAATFTAVEGLTARYIYINQVNRVFGDADPVRGRFHGDSHVAELGWQARKNIKLAAYGYWNEIDENPRLSTRTLGVTIDAKHSYSDDFSVALYGEYASQSDYSANPADYSIDYAHVTLGGTLKKLGVTLGYELLGSNGAQSISSPTATLFKFNGFADQFLTTPAQGLRDAYITANYKFGDIGWLKNVTTTLWYHDYQSDADSIDFGEEFDARITGRAGPFGLSLWLAKYGGSPVKPDVTKVFLEATYVF